MKYETDRAVGKPRKRWEDEINDFLRADRFENATDNAERNNNRWIKKEKGQKVWMRMESKFAFAVAGAPGS